MIAVEDMEEWEFNLHVIGTISDTLKKVEEGAGIFLPVTIAIVGTSLVKLIDDSKMSEENKLLYGWRVGQISTMLLAAWVLKHAESSYAEAGAAAVFGISMFSDQIADFVQDQTEGGKFLSQKWFWEQVTLMSGGAFAWYYNRLAESMFA